MCPDIETYHRRQGFEHCIAEIAQTGPTLCSASIYQWQVQLIWLFLCDQVDILSPVAMENLSYIAHEAQGALTLRGFPWKGGPKKKKGKGGKKKKK